MKHQAAPAFWVAYERLTPDVRSAADRQHRLLEANPGHPSLHFKKVGPYYSARVTRGYRALAMPIEGGYLWFWIGSHADYERILNA